jgi:hypothetical protein
LESVSVVVSSDIAPPRTKFDLSVFKFEFTSVFDVCRELTFVFVVFRFDWTVLMLDRRVFKFDQTSVLEVCRELTFVFVVFRFDQTSVLEVWRELTFDWMGDRLE